MEESPPSLYELALQQCIKYASLVVDIGGLPYTVVKPFLAKLGHDHLAAIESKCPHIVDESDELWQNLIAREFKDRRIPSGNFRQTFYQYRRDKEAQLGAARERLKINQEQYNKNKKATSVVALSETDLPMAQRNGIPQAPFKSRTMQSVARRAQANMQFRKTPSTHLPPKYVKTDSPLLMKPRKYPRNDLSLGHPPRPSSQPMESLTPHSHSSSPFRTPPMSPPSSSGQQLQHSQDQYPRQEPQQQHMAPRQVSAPPAKRKRVSSVFMPKR